MSTTISSLRLVNFRSYSDFAIELSDGVNIIVGPNASGKTNLLESILLISGLKPYRANIIDTINTNHNWARIESIYGSNNRILKIKKADDKASKVYELNSNTKTRLNFEEKLPVVLFEPEHMRLLTGSPELRRQFVDNILSEIDKSYSKLLGEYKRSLLQRNKLLKQPIPAINQQIFAWNVRLCELAGKIVIKRLELIDKLNNKISNIYSQIANKTTKVNLLYESSVNLINYETTLLSKLEQNLQLDTLRGYTAYGPHRDDLSVFLRQQPAGITASRGETRTLVLSLKILEKQLIEEYRNIKPIVLLDDVFSELDGLRRKSLTGYLKDYQTIITTTDADVISKNFAQHTNLISL
jgi:DNA replication and repair protein RecF